MPRRKYDAPATTSHLTMYAELEEVLRNFAAGKIKFGIILGKPGLSKGESTKKALMGKAARIIKGDHSHPMLYCTLYEYQDKPIVFDDTDKLMDQSWFQDMLKNLTETNKYKKLEYGKKSPILAETESPVYFWTTSSVLLIMNWWDTNNALCTALESRAEFFVFEPSWYECYTTWSTWFDDQEIYDYVYDNLEVLKHPDARMLVKARQRKHGGLALVTWKKLIDDHIDDKTGQEVRRLIKDKKFATNSERAKAFEKKKLGDRATFYRRMADIKSFLPFGEPKPERIILKAKAVIEQERPKDGPIPGGKVEDVESMEDEKEMTGERSAQPLRLFKGGEEKGECKTLEEATELAASCYSPTSTTVKDANLAKVAGFGPFLDSEQVQDLDDLQNRILAWEDDLHVAHGLRVRSVR